jgi:hypothetical protein
MKRSLMLVLTASCVLSFVAAASAGDKGGKYGTISNLISSFKKNHKHDEPKPLDPGRGDGRVPLDPGRGDGRVLVDPNPTNVDVRDHRSGTTSQGSVGLVWVNGHWERAKATTQQSGGGFPAGADVRDHRSSNNPPLSPGNGTGGVTVTTDPNSKPRDNSVTGSGWPFDIFDVGEVPPNRDHRTQTVTRDHR